MTDVVVTRPLGLRYGTLVTVLLALLVVAIPICWAAGTFYGANKASASATFWIVFTVVYFTILVLPWLNLKGQEHFSRAQRLERMCISWLWLDTVNRLVWDLPWVVLFNQIMAGKGQVWTYLWWSYMDGGDTRYAIRDVHLLVIEVQMSIVAIVGAYVLWSYIKSRRFSHAQLMTIMALMVCDFCSTYIYFATEALAGLRNVGSLVDLIVKFVCVNFPWIVMPWVVYTWAGQKLSGREAVGRMR
jgi:hypothetical protein